MLKLDLNLKKEQQSIRLGKIRDRFARYFGFVASGSISEALALNQAINSQRQNEGTSINPGERLRLTSDPEAVQVFNIFLDTGSGALKSVSDQGRQSNNSPEETNRSIKGKIESLILGASVQSIEKCSGYVQMHYSNDYGGSSNENERSKIFHNDLNTIGFEDDEITNSAKNKMSAFRMIHPLLTPGGKNADLLTIFFNAFPTLELVRATPVLNIKMYSSRQVFQDGKLAAISLQKFLEGAVDAPQGTEQNSALRAIGLANQVSASNFGDNTLDFQYYSIAGMELFRAPQTMVNPDATKIKSNFLAPVIDPFRPLASIKSFDVDVRSAVGLISTKTAKLELVLHDRSRMGEFADIIKPDRYGTSFIEAEYGWSHPDQMQDNPNSLDGNPYADILNLTRTKEHYNITNSSFSFDEVGQVNISLNLVTRGSSEMTELSITGNQEELRRHLTLIADISKQINRLSSLVYGNQENNQNGTSTHRREIRGQQILGAAGDATNMLVVNSDMLRDLVALRSSLDHIIDSGNSTTQSSGEVRTNANSLSARITDLIGPANARGNIQSVDATSAIGRVQTTVNNNIKEALKLINRDGTDPIDSDIFLRTMPEDQKTYFRSHQTRTSMSEPARNNNSTAAQATRSENNQLLDVNELNSDPGLTNRKAVVSLGTLFMAFVAKPLAKMQDKFEEVQVYFYNFNNKASKMSHCNISHFPITTDYFAREYSRLRLENLNRSVNLSLIDFVNFLSTKMVDDPMNPAYGINNLYKYNSETRELEINTRNPEIGNNERTRQDNFNRIMRAVMEGNNIGHSPEFQMPQLTIDIEAVPYYYDEKKTILKIHVYDKACSSTAPLRELLSLSTENLMSTLSSFPASREAATAEVSAQSQAASENTNQTNRRAHGGRNSPATATPFDEHHLRRNWQESYNIILNHAIREKIITEIRPNISSDTQSTNTQPTGTQQQTPRPVNPLYRFTGGPKRLKEMVMQYVPHIIYGSMYSTVKSANLSTQQNAQLASINMLRSLNGDPVSANGEQAGGVPLSVYPCELSITTLGCPFIRYSQEIFVDFNTNTTADNIYYVTGLTHKIEAGNYETTIKLTPNDAFGQYRNMISQLNTAGTYINDLTTHDIPITNNTTGQQRHHHHHRRR